jgi:glutamine phosphoribosylpyrophosphate amidotransferase
MCGIVAAVSTWSRVSAIDLMTRAGDRGPHGWGIAVLTPACGLTRVVGFGQFRPDAASTWPRSIESGPMIGHTRLATSADRGSGNALQPIIFTAHDGEQFAIAHNGTIPDVDAWSRSLDCRCVTGNDSEMIGHFLAGAEGAWSHRLTMLATWLTTPYALAIWTIGAVWLMRRRHPLFVSSTAACSRPFAMGVELTDDDRPYALVHRPGLSAGRSQ